MPSGSGWLARLCAGQLGRLLDKIDNALEAGSILVRLPGGANRLLGGRGAGPAADVTIRDWRALLRLATSGSVGWYRAWEEGEWDSPDPVPMFDLFMRNAQALGSLGRAMGPWRGIAQVLHFARRNSRRQARRNISAHYDLGNDFYAQWLDPTMSYSSALWEGLSPQASLEAAQRNKVAALARRLALKPGDRVLEIGCGWGHLAGQLAESCNVKVTGISLSEQQLASARAQPGSTGTTFRHQDYRDVAEQFDAVASVEMVEAVGREYWPAFFDCLARTLKPGGRAALQFISMRDDLFEGYAAGVDFIQAYIFPGGILICASEFERLARERGLAWQDRTDFGTDYARTLRLWRENFDRAVAEQRLPAGFDARFLCLWRYYLMYCEGGFRGGGITVSQVTLVRG